MDDFNWTMYFWYLQCYSILQLSGKSIVGQVVVLASFGASTFQGSRNISTVVGGLNPEFK